MSTLFTRSGLALACCSQLPLSRSDLTAGCDPPAPAPPEMDDSRSSYDPPDIAITRGSLRVSNAEGLCVHNHRGGVRSALGCPFDLRMSARQTAVWLHSRSARHPSKCVCSLMAPPDFSPLRCVCSALLFGSLALRSVCSCSPRLAAVARVRRLVASRHA